MAHSYLQYLMVLPEVLHYDLSRLMTSVRAHSLVSHVPELDTGSAFTFFMDYSSRFTHPRLKKAYYLTGDENLLLGRSVQIFAVPVSGVTRVRPP